MFFLNTFEIILTFLLLIVLIYLYLRQNLNYWKSRGIKGPEPIIFFGIFWQILFGRLSEILIEHYKQYGKIYGIFIGNHPALAVADPDVIKDITIKDFHIFQNREDIHFDDFSASFITSKKDDDWRKMRSIISGTFSSSKMRRMHPKVIDCIERFEKYYKTVVNIEVKNEVDLKKMLGRLMLDVTTNCAFATKIDFYDQDKLDLFEGQSKQFLRANWRNYLFYILSTTFPSVLKLTGFRYTDPSVTSFFGRLINSIISQRDGKQHQDYTDYLQLLIDAKNKKSDTNEKDIIDINENIFGQADEKISSTKSFELTDNDILANSIIFFVAGYETTTSLISHLLYSLAVNDDCQQKLYEEIQSCNGVFDYDSLAKLSYLEACIAETLRMYTNLPFLPRLASQDYYIKKYDLTIPKGMFVYFNIQALHYDPEYYPEPYKWDPTRFILKNSNKLKSNCYMPFGMGPRNCVGMRFTLTTAKTVIAHLVNKFKFTKTENTRIPLRAVKYEVLLNMGEIKVGIEQR